MKKFGIFMALILAAGFTLFSGDVYAHTGLSASTPSKDSVVKSDVTEIVLDFNTQIEPVSRLIVTNESGEEIPLEELQVSERRMTGRLTEPLPNGSYTVLHDHLENYRRRWPCRGRKLCA